MTLFPIQNGTAIIPQGTTIIEDRAFFGCKELTTVIIPEGVTTIGESAFRECTALTHVVFPSTITHIGDLAFFETPWDKNLPCDENDLPKELYIGTALYKAAYDIDVIEVKEGTTCICSSAFCCHTTLTKVVLPDSVKYIGGVAFAQCPNLKSITLPKNLEKIGFSCFMHTGLESITIPEGVKTIEKRAFYGCENLKDIHFAGAVGQWQQCREEVKRLKRELKMLNANRTSLTDPIEIDAARAAAHHLQEQYNAALLKLKEMKDEYEWQKSVNREFDCIEQPDNGYSARR